MKKCEKNNKTKIISSAQLLFAHNNKQPQNQPQEQEARDNNSTNLDLIHCLTINLADHHVSAR